MNDLVKRLRERAAPAPKYVSKGRRESRRLDARGTGGVAW
jgi:hypothetical protein